MPEIKINHKITYDIYAIADVLDDWINDLECISDLESEDIYILPELLEKMKSFRVKHFSSMFYMLCCTK